MQHLVLPAVTLAVIPAGIITRTMRGTVSEILGQDFIGTLRGKGLRGRTVPGTWWSERGAPACSR